MSDDPINNDELSAFVASTLRAVARGVREAASTERLNEANGHSQFEIPHAIKFDIAVSARSAGESGGGFKIKVFDVGGEGGKKKSDESESVSRIVFEVPWVSKFGGSTRIPPRANVV